MKKVTLELWYDDGVSDKELSRVSDELEDALNGGDWIYLAGKIEKNVREPDEANTISS